MFFLVSLASVQYSGEKDFLGMPGKKVTHQIEDKSDPISKPEIIELVDQHNQPIWFGRYVSKVVCDDGLCRIASLWLFWDKVGDFYGFQIMENDPLTKTDHIDFMDHDYAKLHEILSNKNWALKDLQMEDLVVKHDIDGTSGATNIEYKDDLVDNAAYTCYTLWHAVYGETYKEVGRIINSRIDSLYLDQLMDSDKANYRIWAIKYVMNKPEYREIFGEKIMSLIRDKDDSVSQTALLFLTPSTLNTKIREDMLTQYGNLSFQRKLEVLIRLSEIKPVSDDIILFLLDDIDLKKVNATLLTYIYKIIEKSNFENNQIHDKVVQLSRNDNQYIKQISRQLLVEIKE
ncbi:MAG: hypothetical protein PHE51_11550 [Eubacteriales bacterium]|nr:hypothetical protein [Eubacteriales bacterium]